MMQEAKNVYALCNRELFHYCFHSHPLGINRISFVLIHADTILVLYMQALSV